MIKKDFANSKDGKLIVRKEYLFYFSKNLAVLDKEYIEKLTQRIENNKSTDDLKPSNPMVAEIIAAEPKVVKIDPDVTIRGVTNPLMTVFIGFSTRNLYDAMKRKKKKIDNIFFIEPDIGVFKHLLMTEDISDLLVNPKYEFVVGINNEQLLTVLFKLMSQHDPKEAYSRMTKMQSMQRVFDPFTHDTNKDNYAKINTIVDETVTHLQLSMGCSDDQFRRWEMMFENKDVMLKANSVKPMYDKFKDVPVIVCGGGPSLSDFIKEAKANPKIVSNSLIIAADAVLSILLKEGIRPNIVVRCERKLTGIFKDSPKEVIKGEIGAKDITPIYYAAYPWTPKAFFDLFENHLYLFRTNGVCTYTNLSQHGVVNGGVSSGNACVELALVLGAKNIILTGLDMCFIGNSTHIEGTQVEFNVENSKKKGVIPVVCNDGKTRDTIKVWYRCYNEYQQSIEKHRAKHEFEVINTSLQGASLKGSVHKPWKDVIDLFNKDVNITEMINKYKGKIGNKAATSFYEKNKVTKKMLQEVKTSIEVTESLVKEAKRTCNREIEKIFNTVLDDYSGFEVYEKLKEQELNFEKLWFSVADAYDLNFKNKWLNNMDFRIMFLDVLQLDTFYYENQVQAIANMIDTNSLKYKQYCKFTKAWLDKIKYYCNEFIRVLEEFGDK